MIPPFDHNYVLPPYVGNTPTVRAAQSPYYTDIMELCKHFGVTRSRVNILKGFVQFRLEAYIMEYLIQYNGLMEVLLRTN